MVERVASTSTQVEEHIKFKHFVPKVEAIRAIKWEPGIMVPGLTIDSLPNNTFTLTSECGPREINVRPVQKLLKPRDYIVFYPHGDWDVIPPEQFKELYKPAKGGNTSGSSGTGIVQTVRSALTPADPNAPKVP